MEFGGCVTAKKMIAFAVGGVILGMGMTISGAVSYHNKYMYNVHVYTSGMITTITSEFSEVKATYSGGFSHGSMGSMEPPFLPYIKIYIQANPATYSLIGAS